MNLTTQLKKNLKEEHYEKVDVYRVVPDPTPTILPDYRGNFIKFTDVELHKDKLVSDTKTKKEPIITGYVTAIAVPGHAKMDEGTSEYFEFNIIDDSWTQYAPELLFYPEDGYDYDDFLYLIDTDEENFLSFIKKEINGLLLDESDSKDKYYNVLDSIKQEIKDEFGFNITHLDVNPSWKTGSIEGVPDYIKRYLQEAKEIGLDVDSVSYGYPGIEDNQVGNYASRIRIEEDAGTGNSLLMKELYALNYSQPYNPDMYDTICQVVLHKPLHVDNYGNIFVTDGDWSIQGIKDEYVGIYYHGADKEMALHTLKGFI